MMQALMAARVGQDAEWEASAPRGIAPRSTQQRQCFRLLPLPTRRSDGHAGAGEVAWRGCQPDGRPGVRPAPAEVHLGADKRPSWRRHPGDGGGPSGRRWVPGRLSQEGPFPLGSLAGGYGRYHPEGACDGAGSVTARGLHAPRRPPPRKPCMRGRRFCPRYRPGPCARLLVHPYGSR